MSLGYMIREHGPDKHRTFGAPSHQGVLKEDGRTWQQEQIFNISPDMASQGGVAIVKQDTTSTVQVTLNF